MAESESDEEAIRLEAASKAVRKHCRKLTISLNKNDVPEHLLEEELIEDETHQLLDPLTRKTQIYHGVLRAVKSNPEAIFKLCRILEKDEVGGAALSRSLQDEYSKKMRELGNTNGTSLAEQQLCSEFQRLKCQMNVYSKDLAEGIVSVESVQSVIHTAIENALKTADGSDNIQSLRDQISSLCFKALIIPPSMHEWTMQEFDKVHQCSSDSPPLPRLKAKAAIEKPSLFCKETIYHSSICCDALGRDKPRNFNAYASGHLLQEASISLYQEELENANSHVIARQDNTFYVAFQSEPTLSDWLKSPHQSFDEGLEVQMKQFPLRFLEQLLREQKKIVLTGFSFGGMLACYVAANLWKKSPTSGDVLESNVICITFGIPLVPMPYVQAITKDFPKFKSTIFSVFVEEDYFPRVLRYLQCGYMYHCNKSPSNLKPDVYDEKSNLDFKATYCDEFLHNLAKQEHSYSNVVSSQASPLPNDTATGALVHLKKALKEVIPHAQESPSVIIGNCFIISRSLEDGQSHTWNPCIEEIGVLQLGYLTTQAVEKLGMRSFSKHVMSEYRQRVLKSHIDKDPDRYLPSRQQSHGSKEIKGVSILKPNPTGAAFHKYPGEHVIVLNGENLSFCRKVRLGDKLEVKLPAEDVTPRMIQLNLKPSGETKSLISKTGTVKVTVFSHFSKSMTKKVPVTQEPFTFNLRQIQLAKYSPAEVILLAFMSALLEQFPEHATPNPSSKRFNEIAKFLEEVVKVVPLESVLWSIAFCDDYTAVQSAKALMASRTKIPMTSTATIEAAQRAIVRLHTGAISPLVDSVIHTILKKEQISFLLPISLICVSAPSSKKLQVDIKIQTSRDPHSPSFSDVTQQRGQIERSIVSQTVLSYFANLNMLDESLGRTYPDIAYKLERFLNPERVTTFRKEGNWSLNIEHVYPANQQRRFSTAPSTLQSPITVLRDARESIASFIQDSLHNPEPNRGGDGGQLNNQRMLSLVREIYEQNLRLCTSLLGAFMEQQMHIPLLKSEVSTASALEESSSPVAIGVWALFNVNHEELEKMLSSMGNTRLMVEIRDYIAGVLSDDLKSDELQDGQNSRYNAKLQFLLQGIKSTVSCSSQYISYSLERQLSSNLSNNSRFKESYTVKELVKRWSKIFREDALSLVATSHRPLIARWLKWALLIHKLRETLAEYTCVGVTGLINSGKSQLVSKLFGVQTNVGTTERKRTTVPLLYNLDDKVKGLDVIDFPGVGDKDHSLPELAELLLGLIQVVIFVIDQRRISLDMVKTWLKFLEDKDVPVIVCMTHADHLYTEFMDEEEGNPPEPTPYKSRRFQIDLQEKEKIICPHPSRTLHYCCFHRPGGYMEELSIENFKKVGIKSPQDIGDELVKVFSNKLDQKSLADRLSEFIHKNDNRETQNQSPTVLSPRQVSTKTSPNSLTGTAKMKRDTMLSSADTRDVPPQNQSVVQPKPERMNETKVENTESVSCISDSRAQMTSDFIPAFSGNQDDSATNCWKLEDVHSKLRLDGKGITIAVLDTGVNVKHQAFETAWKEGRIQGANFLSQSDWKQNSSSHGSMAAFVASGSGFCPEVSKSIQIPCGVAPGAGLLICLVGEVRLYAYQPVILALQTLLDRKKSSKCIDIIIMAFGIELDHNSEKQSKIRELIEELQKEEVVCVAASGNYGKYTNVLFPACLDSVISVGTLNPHGYRSESNTPKDIDVYAPGKGIASPSNSSKNGVEFHDGSSCATPAIAGLVALLLQYANDHISDHKKKKQFRDSFFLRKEILGKDMKKRGDLDLLEPCEYFMQRPELQSLIKQTTELKEEDPFSA